jgi:chromosome segregation ATPase
LIEAVMLVMLGFLSATLLALAAVPALARRADRLARKRAEAAFPLSLAEIAADRDHLRAELALRARGLEQQAERGFAAKAAAMQDIGRRDMTIGQLERDLRAGEARIADLDADLTATRGKLAETQGRFAAETASHVETGKLLDKRVADLAVLERSLAEARMALTGTSADLSARGTELDQERATLGRVQALLSERDAELAALRAQSDVLQAAQLKHQTQMLVLEGQSADLSNRLAAAEQGLVLARIALAAMTIDRDSERLRADTLSARAAQAEAGLAAADAASAAATAETRRIQGLLKQQAEALALQMQAREAAEQVAEEMKAASLGADHKLRQENEAMRGHLREREQRLETLHAEIQTLQGALMQARIERGVPQREDAKPAAPVSSAAVPGGGKTALRRDIMKVAGRLKTRRPKQEAAE